MAAADHGLGVGHDLAGEFGIHLLQGDLPENHLDPPGSAGLTSAFRGAIPIDCGCAAARLPAPRACGAVAR